MSDVAILGCGPAGLFATRAVEEAGHTPFIYSLRIKSEMFGAMYLHRSIPGLTVPEDWFTIDVIKTGTREGYAYNVYGDKDHDCSWDHIKSGTNDAWDLKAVYDRAWDKWYPEILDKYVSTGLLIQLLKSFPLVISSIPAPHLCLGGHNFDAQPIWVVHGEGRHLIEGVNDDDMMYYNGVPWDGSFAAIYEGYTERRSPPDKYMIGHPWYRFSQINRYQAWEHSRDPGPAVGVEWFKTSHGQKPISTNCDCWVKDGLLRVGRFGTWKKGVLTHHAYEQALEAARALH